MGRPARAAPLRRGRLGGDGLGQRQGARHPPRRLRRLHLRRHQRPQAGRRAGADRPRLRPDRRRHPAARQAGPQARRDLLHADHRDLADRLAGAGAAGEHQQPEDHTRRGHRQGRVTVDRRATPRRPRPSRSRRSTATTVVGRAGRATAGRRPLPIPEAEALVARQPLPLRPGRRLRRRTARPSTPSAATSASARSRSARTKGRQPASCSTASRLPVRPARPGLLARRPLHGADRRGPASTTSR